MNLLQQVWEVPLGHYWPSRRSYLHHWCGQCWKIPSRGQQSHPLLKAPADFKGTKISSVTQGEESRYDLPLILASWLEGITVCFQVVVSPQAAKIVSDSNGSTDPWINWTYHQSHPFLQLPLSPDADHLLAALGTPVTSALVPEMRLAPKRDFHSGEVPKRDLPNTNKWRIQALSGSHGGVRCSCAQTSSWAKGFKAT